MAQPLINARFFPKAHNILLIEPPNNLFVGFNATVVGKPLGLQFIAGAVSDIASVRSSDPETYAGGIDLLERGEYAARPKSRPARRVAESVALRS